MKVNDGNISSLGTPGAAGAPGASRTGASNRAAESSGGQATSSQGTSNDDVHLSELVRSLRSLAADSPDRQTKIEALTRAYASGSYQVDSRATASAIISDATKG
jgi:flagellar biosynthesis anti-sigma factor FlgM